MRYEFEEQTLEGIVNSKFPVMTAYPENLEDVILLAKSQNLKDDEWFGKDKILCVHTH